MSKLPRIFAIALTASLTVGVASAATQVELVQSTFAALKQSAAAADQGNIDQARTLLAGMKSSAETLRDTAQRYAGQARDAAARREAEARNVADQITATYQAEQAANKTIADLDGQIAGLTAQQKQAEQTRAGLDADAAALRREGEIRNECSNKFLGGLFSGECISRSWDDLVANKANSINRDIEDNNRQRRDIYSALGNVQNQLDAERDALAQTSARKRELEAKREALRQQSQALQATVVSLSDAALFWTDTATLIGSRITSIETLQQDLQLLVKRASATATAPAFNSYDKAEVRSLEATLVEFARTLDNRTNVLLAPSAEPGGFVN